MDLLLLWAGSIYGLAFWTFILLVPQGFQSGWHALFFFPALCTALVGSAIFWSRAWGRVIEAIHGALIGFVVSLMTGSVACALTMPPGGEAAAWHGIPLVPVVFFATITGAAVGALRAFSH